MAPRPAAAVCLGPGLLVGALLAAELAALVMLLTAEDKAELLEAVTVVAASLPEPVVTVAVAEALPVEVVAAAVAQVALVGKLVAPLFLQNCFEGVVRGCDKKKRRILMDGGMETYGNGETSGSVNIAGRALLQETALDLLDEGLVRADALGVAAAVTDAVNQVGRGTVGLFCELLVPTSTMCSHQRAKM